MTVPETSPPQTSLEPQTSPEPANDVWTDLRRSTQARIGLGRVGDGLPTGRVLEFRLAHAAARDAVHDPLDVAAFAAQVEQVGLGRPAVVRSRAGSRAEYLRRPDLGRLPADLDPVRDVADPDASGVAEGDAGGVARADVGFVLCDGLSALALRSHGVAMLSALAEALPDSLSLAPPVIAVQARVALGDHIGQAIGVRTVLVLIGERPGLSVADSLGVYLTHRPEPGRTDADRNCVSNIHPPEGLGYADAARVVSALLTGARELGRSGVDLKDTSRETELPDSVPGPPILP